MINLIKQYLSNFCVYSIISLGINSFFLYILKTPFFPDFMEKNLITITIALMAINLSTLGIILSRIAALNVPANAFKRTRDSMWRTVKEELCILVLSILVVACKTSPVISFSEKEFAFGCFLTFLFVWLLHALWDISKSVFIIISMPLDNQ